MVLDLDFAVTTGATRLTLRLTDNKRKADVKLDQGKFGSIGNSDSSILQRGLTAERDVQVSLTGGPVLILIPAMPLSTRQIHLRLRCNTFCVRLQAGPHATWTRIVIFTIVVQSRLMVTYQLHRVTSTPQALSRSGRRERRSGIEATNIGRILCLARSISQNSSN
jgi:hypothetical protein